MGPAAVTNLQSLLESGPPAQPGAEPPRSRAEDPVAALAALEAQDRFRRDTGLGRIFHPGELSLREVSPANSLHISIDGNRISAHVDRFSPLNRPTQGRPRYALRSVAAHNAVGVAEDLVRLVRGRQGHHRSQLDCEWLWPDDMTAAGIERREVGAEPAGVQVEAGVAGRLDAARLATALKAVVGRDQCDIGLTVLDCPDEEAVAGARQRLHDEEVPLTRGPPLRALLARRPAGDLFMLNVNHAAADGPGALYVLQAIAGAYAGGAVRPLEFLACSDLPVRPAPPKASKGRRGYRAVMEKARDLLSPPARMTSEGSQDRPGFGFHHVRLSKEETRSLVAPQGAVVEDEVLLGALHAAVAAWNTGHGRRSHQISVLITDDLRPGGWDGHVVGNFSITARISTNRRERTDPTTAMHAVTDEIHRNRRNGNGRALIQGLHRTGLLGLWAKQSTIVLLPLSGNRLVDTALLCNLGSFPDPHWFGVQAGPMTGIWFSVPPRVPVGLSVGAVTLAGRLHLCVRYRHRLFSAEAAGRFAECYVAQLRQLGLR